MAKRKQVYLSPEEAKAVYARLWNKLRVREELKSEDGDTLAVHRCLIAAARARLARAFPELADERIEGKP